MDVVQRLTKVPPYHEPFVKREGMSLVVRLALIKKMNPSKSKKACSKRKLHDVDVGRGSRIGSTCIFEERYYFSHEVTSI